MYSKANRGQVIKPEVLVVGIDVAKRRHVATIRLPDGTKKKAFSFSNDRSGFGKLVARAESVRASSDTRAILFAIESSGHYGHALKHSLSQGGYQVVGINPAHTKKAKEIEDNSPEKNDSKDSRIISDLAAQGRGRPVMIPRGVYADLRRLGKLRELEQTRKRLVASLTPKNKEILDEEFERLVTHRRELEDRLRELRSINHKEVDVDVLADEIMASLRRFEDLFPLGTQEEQKEFIGLFVDRIELDPDRRVGKVYMKRLPVPKDGSMESLLVCVAGARCTHQTRIFPPIDVIDIRFERQGKARVPARV